MPVFDDYTAVLDWMCQYLSSPNLHDKFFLFFRQNFEHRIVFDYFAELLCFHLFHKINFVFLSFFGSMGLFGIVATLLYAGKKNGLSHFELIPVPFLLLTLSQSDLMWYNMASLQQYWQLLFVILLLIVLIGSTEKSALIVALLLLVGAIFSGGGGLLAAPIGLCYLVLSKQWRAALLWSVSSVFVIYIYFVVLKYEPTAADRTAHAYVHANPAKFLIFSIRFIGNFGRSTTYALIFGLISIAAAIPLFALSVGKTVQSFMYIVMFVWATAFAVAYDRSFWGPQFAISSRYTIYGLLALALIYMTAVSLNRSHLLRRFTAVAGIIVSVAVYMSWINPALAALRQMHAWETTSVVTYPFLSIVRDPRVELRTAMNEGVFYPHTLYSHLPKQIENNRQYNQAWVALFGIYLFRPDLQNAFPLTSAASYTPILRWAAMKIPSYDPAYAQVKPLQPVYASMLAHIKQ